MTIGRHKFCGRPLLGTVRDWPNAIAFLTADILRSSCAMHDRKALFYAEVCVDDDRDIRLRLAIAAVKLNAGTLDRHHRRHALFEAIAQYGTQIWGKGRRLKTPVGRRRSPGWGPRYNGRKGKVIAPHCTFWTSGSEPRFFFQRPHARTENRSKAVKV